MSDSGGDGVGSSFILQWLTHSVGLVGTLYAFGYVIQTAHQELLGGITFGDAEPSTTYLLSAGGFLLNLMLLLLAFLVESVGSVVVCGLGVAAVWIALAKFQKLRDIVDRIRARANRALCSWRGPAVLLLLILFKIAYFDTPVMRFTNVLMQNASLERQFHLPDLAEIRAERLWKDLLCSRIPNDARCKSADGACQSECNSQSQDDDKRANRNRFLSSVLLTGALVVASAYVLRRRDQMSGADGKTSRYDPAVICLVVPLLMAILGVPYLFGKTVMTTEFPKAAVELDAPLQGTNRPQALAAGAAPPESIEGYLLAESPASIILLPLSETGEAPIWEIPRARIRSIAVYQIEDVFADRIIKTMRR